jgi:hypothetical protein
MGCQLAATHCFILLHKQQYGHIDMCFLDMNKQLFKVWPRHSRLQDNMQTRPAGKRYNMMRETKMSQSKGEAFLDNHKKPFMHSTQSSASFP